MRVVKRLNKLKLIAVLISISFISMIGYAIWQTYFLSKEFNLRGNFTIHSIKVVGKYSIDKAKAISFHIRPSLSDGGYNFSIPSSIDWIAKKLYVLTCSSKGSGLYDTLLFETNGSANIRVISPSILRVNSTRDLLIYGTGNNSFFMKDPVPCLVLDQINRLDIEAPSGSSVLFLDAIFDSGAIEIYGNQSFSKNIENDRVGLLLETSAFRSFSIKCNGHFTVFEENWTSTVLESWLQEINVSFYYPEGFISCGTSIKDLTGGQDLELTDMKGKISLSKHDENYEAYILGRAGGAFIGGVDITTPSLSYIFGSIRDCLTIAVPIFCVLLMYYLNVKARPDIKLYIDKEVRVGYEETGKSEKLERFQFFRPDGAQFRYGMVNIPLVFVNEGVRTGAITKIQHVLKAPIEKEIPDHSICYEEPSKEVGVERRLVSNPFPLPVQNKECRILFLGYYLSHFLPDLIINYPNLDACKIEIEYRQTARKEPMYENLIIRYARKDLMLEEI